MREAVSALAMQGEPSVGDLMEHEDGKTIWPTQSVQSTVYNTEVPSIAFAELEAATPLLVWLHADLIIKRLDALVDAESDDKSALTVEERQRRAAEVQADLLDTERLESCLVRQAQAQNMPCQHRGDCAPQAILQVRLVTAPAVNPPPGTSPEHVITFGGRR